MSTEKQTSVKLARTILESIERIVNGIMGITGIGINASVYHYVDGGRIHVSVDIYRFSDTAQAMVTTTITVDDKHEFVFKEASEEELAHWFALLDALPSSIAVSRSSYKDWQVDVWANGHDLRRPDLRRL